MTKSFDSVEDGICGCNPDEGLGLSVVLFDELVDSGNQFFDASESSRPNGFLGDDVGPDFYLIEPRGIRGCVVNLIAGMSRQPPIRTGVSRRQRSRR